MLLPKSECPVDCPLYGDGLGFSRPEGGGALGVLIVGEALGRNERNDGLPFRPYAEAGSVLERAIRRAGFTRDQFVLWNVVACRPPENELEGKPYEAAAIDNCRRHFDRVVSTYRPRAILALGNVALRALTDLTDISSVRGFVLESRYGIPLVASFHPAFLRRGQMRYFGVLIRDMQLAVSIAKRGFNRPGANYLLYPSEEEAEQWASSVEPGTPLAYDIETVEVAGKGEEDLEWSNTEIVQIQFARAPGDAIVMPWMGRYVETAKRLLSGPNPKWGFNNWAFDDPVLDAHGIEVRGENHDLMWAWHHLQPDLDRNLQFVTSFYQPLLAPWKHLSKSDLAFYGAVDVDALMWIGQKIFADLRAHGLEASYERHIVRLHRVLRAVSERGIPIDRDAQQKFRAELEQAKERAFAEMQELVPDGLKPAKPYKRDSEAMRRMAQGGKWERRTIDGVERWCRIEPFRPSPVQLKAYMRHRGHRVPHLPGESKESTFKLGLQRLWVETGDPLYAKVLEYREIEKMASAYLWPCGDDGRVHATFTFAPATGQISARRPPVQTGPNPKKMGRLAERFRSIIAAPPGHLIVEFDYKSFHVLTLGFEARDPDYMRMARIDMHSFVAATRLLRVEREDELLALPDEELKERLRWWRKSDRTWEISGRPRTFAFVRDERAKPSILGYGFGLGARKLFEMNRESFSTLAEAKAVLDALNGLFPRTARFRDEIRALAHKQGFLKSRYGYVRYFWNVMTWDAKARRWRSGEDSEAAVAFLPANDAFGIKKEAMLRLEEGGWNERARLINEIHDALLFEIPKNCLEEAIAAILGEMERPSETLVDPETAPEGLWCEVSVAAGPNWGRMSEFPTEDLRRGRR